MYTGSEHRSIQNYPINFFLYALLIVLKRYRRDEEVLLGYSGIFIAFISVKLSLLPLASLLWTSDFLSSWYYEVVNFNVSEDQGYWCNKTDTRSGE